MTNRDGVPADAPSGPARSRPPGRAWRLAEWTLFVAWFSAAVVAMYPALGRALRLSGTLFTSYAADLTNPAWVYILFRRRPGSGVARWFGRTPELAAGSIFAVGVASEVGQKLWPRGFWRGTFDPLDIVAFGAGIAVCYAFDRRELRAKIGPTREGDRA